MPRSDAGAEWEFDATTTVESNRKKPSIDLGVCPRCKHIHAAPGHDGASGALGGIVRCWFMQPRRSARLQDKHGKYRRCRCVHGDTSAFGEKPDMLIVKNCPCWVCAGGSKYKPVSGDYLKEPTDGGRVRRRR